MRRQHTQSPLRRVRGFMVVGILAAVAACFGLIAQDTAAVPPGGPSNSNANARVTVAPKRVKQGAFVAVSGTRFPKSRTVTIKLDDQHILKTFRTNRNGAFSGRVKVPARVSTGRHWLRFLAPRPNTSIKGAFTVIAK